MNNNIQNKLNNNSNNNNSVKTFIKYDNNSNKYPDNNDDIKTSREILTFQKHNSFLNNDNNDIKEGNIYTKDIPLDINYKKNNFVEPQKAESNNSVNNQNTSIKSQTKSLLSEYVEDLDIMQ